MRVVIVAAIASNGVIGDSRTNSLPWPAGTYKEDRARFKELTLGSAVVMGRKTWESLPPKFRPLPGRTNIVVSKGWAMQKNPGVAAVFVPEFQSARWAAERRDAEKLYVIGGASLYAEALPLADELDLTLIGKDYDGDVYFPTRHLALDVARSIGWSDQEGGHSDFVCVSREPCPTNPDLTFTKWVRR